MELQKQLLELSAKVEEHLGIFSVSQIEKSLELSDNITLPYTFTVEALHPGTFKGFHISRDEIVKAKDSIFLQRGCYANNEINKDHKGNRKLESSVDDLIGKITQSDYDYTRDAYILKGEVYDMPTALKIQRDLLKYVSLRIIPGRVDNYNGQNIARDLEFQELSFVRAPGDTSVKIIDKD